MQDGWEALTWDSGADTWIFGTGWHVTEVYPNQQVNIVGFDTAHAKRRGLPMGQPVLSFAVQMRKNAL